MTVDALDDVALSELLCRDALDADRSEQRRRALRHAAHAARRWPIEARTRADERRRQADVGCRLAIVARSVATSTGFVRWRSKPASCASATSLTRP